MSAPSTFRNASHDGRYDVDTIDAVELVDAPVTGRAQRVFPARLAGQCAGCRGKVTPGEAVTRGLDGAIEHASCPEDVEESVQGICTGCNLEIPLSGVCGWC